MEFMEKQQIRKLIDEQLNDYAPVIASGPTVIATLIASRVIGTRVMAMLHAQGLITKAAYEKYVHNTRSNNWLKMHGYPLRRKAR
jgi:hypothetical protein